MYAIRSYYVIYTDLSNDPIIKKYISFIQEDNQAQIRQDYFNLVKDLIAVEMSFETYLFTKMIEINNPVLERLCHKNYNLTALDKACLKNDLDILKNIVNSNIDNKINAAKDNYNILSHIVFNESPSITINSYKNYFASVKSINNDKDINLFIDILKTYGTGIFARNNFV